jgi:hypothetical protein
MVHQSFASKLTLARFSNQISFLGRPRQCKLAAKIARLTHLPTKHWAKLFFFTLASNGVLPYQIYTSIKSKIPLSHHDKKNPYIYSQLSCRNHLFFHLIYLFAPILSSLKVK